MPDVLRFVAIYLVFFACLTSEQSAHAFVGPDPNGPSKCFPHETVAEFVDRTEIILWGKLKNFAYEDGHWKITLKDIDPIKGVPKGVNEFVYYSGTGMGPKIRKTSLDEFWENVTVIGEEDVLVPSNSDPSGKEWLEKQHYFIAVSNPTWRDTNHILFTGDTVMKGTERERHVIRFPPNVRVCYQSFSPTAFSRNELTRYLMFYKFRPYIPLGAVIIVFCGWFSIRTYLRRRKVASA